MKTNNLIQIKTIWTFSIFIALIIFYSCNRKTDSSKTIDKSSDTPPDTIISKYYGNDTGEVELFNEGGVKCTISQVIDGSSCSADIYLNFFLQSNNEVEITNITGQMNWKQGDTIIQSPFVLDHLNIIIFNNEDQIDQSSFSPNQLIPTKFKRISGLQNQLLYNLTFSDPNYKNIPPTIDKVLIKLQIDISTQGKLKKIIKMIDLNPMTHKIIIPVGQRND